MTQQLDIRQRNNLLVGNRLAAEITATRESRKAFVVVTPYREDNGESPYDALGRWRPKTFSKYINADHRDIRFNVVVFDVETTVLASYIEESRRSYDAAIEVNTLAAYSGIDSLERLEEAFTNHSNDLSSLDVDWRVLPWWD